MLDKVLDNIIRELQAEERMQNIHAAAAERATDAKALRHFVMRGDKEEAKSKRAVPRDQLAETTRVVHPQLRVDEEFKSWEALWSREHPADAVCDPKAPLDDQLAAHRESLRDLLAWVPEGGFACSFNPLVEVPFMYSDVTSTYP